MRRTTEQMINDSVNAGYELLETGLGKYDEKVEAYRKEGYDVRAWYIKSEDSKSWVLYGKKRVRTARTQKKQEKPAINYEVYTVKQLREIGKKYKISGYYKLSKAELIQKLQAC